MNLIVKDIIDEYRICRLMSDCGRNQIAWAVITPEGNFHMFIFEDIACKWVANRIRESEGDLPLIVEGEVRV